MNGENNLIFLMKRNGNNNICRNIIGEIESESDKIDNGLKWLYFIQRNEREWKFRTDWTLQRILMWKQCLQLLVIDTRPYWFKW